MKRDYYFDNLKFLLISLVVFGHFLDNSAKSTDIEKTLHYFIYLFHMPAFIIISGYFSKNINKTHSRVTNYILIYIQFQIIHYLFSRIILKSDEFITFLNPYFSLWYILSMIFWIFLLPYLSKIKFILPLTILLSIVISFDKNIGTFLSLSRTLIFLPFFMLGFYLNKDIILKLKNNKKIKYALIFVSILSLVFLFFNSNKLDPRWTYGKYSFIDLDINLLLAPFYRLTIYLLSSILSMTLFLVVPLNKTIFSEIGKHTISIYLVQSVLIRLIEHYIVLKEIPFVYRISIYTIGTIIIVYVSSRNITNNILKPVTNPNVKFLQKKLVRT